MLSQNVKALARFGIPNPPSAARLPKALSTPAIFIPQSAAAAERGETLKWSDRGAIFASAQRHAQVLTPKED